MSAADFKRGDRVAFTSDDPTRWAWGIAKPHRATVRGFNSDGSLLWLVIDRTDDFNEGDRYLADPSEVRQLTLIERIGDLDEQAEDTLDVSVGRAR